MSTELSTNKVINIVVDRVLQMIDEGKKLPWHQTWVSGQLNYSTGKAYSGINIFLLAGGCGEYMTFNQMVAYNKKHGTTYRLKEGEGKKYYIILVFKPIKKDLTPSQAQELKKKNPKARVFLDNRGIWVSLYFTKRFYRVYGINQMEDENGNPVPSKVDRNVEGNDPTKEFKQMYFDMETVIKDYLTREGIKLTHNYGQRAFYRVAGDLINMPKKESFTRDLAYYHTLIHEMVHSTGVAFRLNRPTLLEYHDSTSIRGQEELVAEIGASIMLTDCGIDLEANKDILDNTHAYLLHWASWIKDNKNAFVLACTQASKAVDYITQYETNPDEKDLTELDEKSISAE